MTGVMNTGKTAGTRAAPLSWPAEIAPLTSLRFFAALFVVLLHFRERSGLAGLEDSALFTRGYLAVDFFFILSGFVLAHVYMGKVRSGAYSHLAFVEKRLARIWPMHLASLAAVIVLYLVMTLAGLTPNNPARYDFSLLPANLFMLHAWGFNFEQSFNYPSWSVSAEWFAYILFLPFAAVMARLWRRPVLFLDLAVLVFIAFYAFVPAFAGAPLMRLTDGFGIWRIVPEFLIGMGLWRLGLSVSLDRRLTALHVFMAVATMAMLGALGADDFFFVPVFAWLIFAAAETARQKTQALAWLRARPLVYLGDVSFAIYMTHTIVYTVWFNGLGLVLGGDLAARWRTEIWAGGLIAVILAAILAHHMIELPGKTLILRLAPLRRLDALSGGHGERRGQ